MSERGDGGQFGGGHSLDATQDLHDDYADWLHLYTENERTITRRESGAAGWLAWCEANDCDPVSAGKLDVVRYIKSLQRDGLAETTITNHYASVSKFYHFLLTDPEQSIDRDDNPTSDINLRRDHGIRNNSEYIKVVHKEGRDDIIAPGYQSLKPIFDHAPGGTGFTKTRNELLCRLFWQTALRSGEMARVRIDNIDWDERDIRVRSAKLNQNDHPDLYYRHVFWEPHLDYLMYRWRDKREEAVSGGDSPYLFVGSTGEQLSPSYMSRQVKKAAHNAGIQEPLVRDDDGSVGQWLYTAHRLRHSRITHLANKTDMGLNFVRMLAGHASLDTTLAYVDPDWGEARDAFRDATG